MSDLGDIPVAGTVVLLRDAPDGFEVLLMRRPDRGSFAGAWVFPGGRVDEGDRVAGAPEVEHARRAGIREVEEEVGLTVDGLVLLSRWEPPELAPTRIRTWFFVAQAGDGELRLSADEVADARWVSPAAALARHDAGEWALFPPTWVTLHELARHRSVGTVLAPRQEVPFFRTRMVDTPEGTVFHWDDLRLETGTLPWRLVRSSAPSHATGD